MSAVDVLAVIGGDDRWVSVPSRIKDVAASLKFDEKLHGANPQRSTLDFPHAIEILEQQAAKLIEARAAVAELMEANARLTEAVRGFADGEMSSDTRNALYLSKHAKPEAITFGEMCEANDEAEAALARCKGEK